MTRRRRPVFTVEYWASRDSWFAVSKRLGCCYGPYPEPLEAGIVASKVNRAVQL